MIIHGARWWKFDFHAHSPASDDFGHGNKEIKGMKPREWLLTFMEKEIDCVAVTDHNNGLWIDILKNELEKMETESCAGFRKLYLFPGLELNVNNNIHVLGIFPTNYTSENIVEVIGAVDYRKDVECTNKSFAEVVNIIINKGGIPIPAHADKEKGLFELVGPSLKSALHEDKLIAMEVINKDCEKPQIYQELRKELTEILGSDCHFPNQIGEKYTWVKMEVPCIDALWLALHDGNDGVIRSDEITKNPNDFKDRMYLHKLEISEGLKIGRGSKFVVHFNPWLTTIIGGRGSGKSSILNFLRLPLNLDKEVTHSLRKDLEKFFQISKGRASTGMLMPKTKVNLELWKDGRLISLDWNNHEINERHYDFDNNKWIEKGKSKLVNERFPIRIFSQKELYEITEDPNAILKLIDNQFDFIKIKENLQKLIESWLDSKNMERKFQQLIDNQQNVSIKLDDIEAKIKILESSENEKLLKEYKTVNEIDGVINKLVKQFEDITLEVEKVKNIEKITINNSLKDSIDDKSLEIIKNLSEKSNVLIEEIKNKVNDMDNLLIDWKQLFNKLPWKTTKEAVITKYNNLIKKLNNDTSLLENYQNLIEEKQALQKQNIELKKLNVKLNRQKKESKEIYNNIISLNKQIRLEREQIINDWNRNNSNINITLDIMGDIIKSEKEFREIIRKSGDEYRRDILDFDDDQNPKQGILFDIASSTKENVWNVRENLIDDVVNKNEKLSKYFIKHLDSINEKTPEDIDRLKVWFPEDKIIIKLRDENGKLMEIDTGSAGQKTAALLSLILSIDNVPLLIDQPEDDLDTKRISDLVVNGIRHLKLRQQIIVVTHNPNIPVNGGAEQIIHLGIKRGNIQPITMGALQNSSVRYSVCEIMEGGKKALDNRYHRISNALNDVIK